MTDPIDNQELSDFQVSKYRLTGAFVWLGLLVIIVPIWYSNPVNFDPTAQTDADASDSKTILVEKPFLLPGHDRSTASDSKSSEPKQTISEATTKTKSEAADETVAVDKTPVEAAPAKEEPATAAASEGDSEWIIRLVAYRKKEMAETLQGRLKYDYEAFIKYFPKSNYYSVRVGPYTSKALAEKDQKRLDRLLRIQSQLVKFKRTP